MRHQLNLIDPARLPVQAWPSVALLLGLLAMAMAAVLAHHAWESTQFARALALPGATEVAAEGEGQSLPDPAEAQALQRVQRDEALAAALAGVSDLPHDSAARLRALAQALPDSLWLTEVELGGRSGLRIAGGTLDSAALASYVARLGRVDGWQGLPLQVVRLEPGQREAAEADTDAGSVKTATPPWHRFELSGGEMPAAPVQP